MSSVYYNGIPIEQVDFETEFDKELAALESKNAELKARKQTETGLNHHFWVIKSKLNHHFWVIKSKPSKLKLRGSYSNKVTIP